MAAIRLRQMRGLYGLLEDNTGSAHGQPRTLIDSRSAWAIKSGACWHWLGGETFVSFDKKAVALVMAQGQSARVL
jgi:hypothetical protein